MTPEEAIERLKDCKTYAERDMYLWDVYSSPETAKREIESCDLAISALEKQIPKKPMQKGEFHTIEFGKCPNCRNAVTDFPKMDAKYCERCGQALDWSE